jgi:hypothetical protein
MIGPWALLLLLDLCIPFVSGGSQFMGPREFLFSAIVDRFPDRDHRITVRRRGGDLITLRATGVRVEVGNLGPGTWEMIRPGVVVDVYGKWRGAREVDTVRLHVVGGRTGVPPREAIREWREGGRREVTGRVTAVDSARQSLQLKSGEEIVPVEAYDRTRFLRDGRPVTLREVRVGARVRASGEIRSGRLLAEEVVLLETESGRNARSEHALTAERR